MTEIPEAHTRRRDVVIAGHRGDEITAREALGDSDPVVRSSALSALARAGRLQASDLGAGFADISPRVRRKACELAVGRGNEQVGALRAALEDQDPAVVEAACFALGEIAAVGAEAVERLSVVAKEHADALCREAAVAALGAIGEEAGLIAILAATHDKPAVRRRAVLALAPFDGPEVRAALKAALTDRDWQVRQAAEDLGAVELEEDEDLDLSPDPHDIS